MTTAALEIDGVTAQVHMTPGTPEGLAEALHAADQDGRVVAPVGGGTQLDLGNPPRRVDLVLETTALNRVVEYEPADLTVTVEAGIRFADLQRLLGEQGQFLALDPPAQPDATLGGLIATNFSGPLRFAYGTARDLVLGTRVANPDGTLTHSGGRVVKNVAGYDLNKLYVGSLGTLGVIVELSLKLAPIPPATGTIIGRFEHGDAARGLLNAVVHSALAPLAVELLGSSAGEAAGLPRGTLVVLRVGGYPQAVERQVRDLSALIAQHGGQRVDTSDTAWDDLAASRVAALERAVVLKAAVTISAAPGLADLLERQLGDFDTQIWGQAGNGVIFAACSTPPPADVLLAVRGEVSTLGTNASLVVQRCPTPLKQAVEVWGDPGVSIGLMRTLKDKLDPNHTLNPGRYVGGI